MCSSDLFGWRAAFLAMGAPGLVLAGLVLLVLREPRLVRQAAKKTALRESVALSLSTLAAKRTYLAIVGSMILYYSLAYGALTFTVPFILRLHDSDLATTGGIFGGVAASAALLGTVIGGVGVDRLAKRDIRWLCWLAAIGLAGAWPLHILAFTTSSTVIMYTALFAAIALLSAAIPAQLTAIHHVVGSPRRAAGMAVAYFFINLIGMGFGPLITGALSDWLTPAHGSAQALRLALLAMITLFVPAAALMMLAAGDLEQDTEA